jgi:uracil-DNA glycosylase
VSGTRAAALPDTAAWEQVAAAARGCTACAELAAARTSVVVGDPPVGPWSGLALVGEAPGAAEDLAGRPFVGKAGQLLDRLLAEAGVDRANVAVLNTVKCRPPGNRPPKPEEVANCRPFLTAQLRVLAPRLVVALGLTAVTWFLGRRGVRLADVRGRVHQVDVDGLPVAVLPTYHPSAAIRFGPGGAPLAALRADLALAVRSLC